MSLQARMVRGPMCPNSAKSQPSILRIALGLNLAMFIIGMMAGLVAHSSALIADSLDMLADGSAYAIALVAQQRGQDFKVGAARASGAVGHHSDDRLQVNVIVDLAFGESHRA